MDIIQYNAVHKFVGVLDNPPIVGVPSLKGVVYILKKLWQVPTFQSEKQLVPKLLSLGKLPCLHRLAGEVPLFSAFHFQYRPSFTSERATRNKAFHGMTIL